ncbi:MAG: hypothetical protein WKF91_23595 [Segetibacter sp.]
MIKNVQYNQFAERIKRRLEGDWPSYEFTVTNNEIYLYLQDSIAKVMTALAEKSYAVEGIYSVPEGFKTRLTFPANIIKKNWDDNTYEVMLPHPPLNLPLGYSIESPQLAGGGNMNYPLMAVHGFNSGYYNKFTHNPDGMCYRIIGSKMIIDTNGFDIINSGLKLYITMLSPRGETGSETDTINLPDDAMSMVFDEVIARLLPRVGMPRDTINEGANKKTEA